MYKRIDLTQLEGIAVTQDTLEFLQSSYRDAFGPLATVLGDFVIVSGVNDTGTHYTNGWVAINGELLPFVGGLKTSQIIIEEETGNEGYADGSNKTVYFIRRAKLASSGGTAVAAFTRLNTLKQIMADVLSATNSADSRVAKAGDTMTGNLTIPASAAGGHAVNKTEMTAAITQLKNDLLNGAGAAFDTLNELAAALGNDSNFAATVTAALALKAPLASPTFTGNPLVPDQANDDNSGKAANTKYVDTVKAALLFGMVQWTTTPLVGTGSINDLIGNHVGLISLANVTDHPAGTSGAGFALMACAQFGSGFAQVLIGHDASGDVAVWFRQGSVFSIPGWTRMTSLS